MAVYLLHSVAEMFTRLALLCLLSVAAWSLTGKVTALPDNTPLNAASVRIFRAGQIQVAADLETTHDGLFDAPALPPGDCRLEVSKPNYVATTLSLRCEAATPLLMPLTRLGAVSGTVLDTQGRPVPRTHVFALPKSNPTLYAAWRANYHATADEEGRYRIRRLPPGDYLIAASYGDSTVAVGSSGHSGTAVSGVLFYRQTVSISIGDDAPNVNFTLTPNPLLTITGRLHVEKPARGAYWLALASAEQPAIATAVTQSEEDGTFRLTGIAPGAYTLHAAGPSRSRAFGGFLEPEPRFGKIPLTVATENLDGIMIPLEKGATLPIRYEATGPPCPAAATLNLEPLDDTAVRTERETKLTSAAPATLESLAPVRYRAALTGLGPACHAEPVIIDLTSAEKPAPLVLRPKPAGRLQGRLTATAQPAAFAIVLAAGPLSLSATPGPDGRFEFPNLAPGLYRVSVRPLNEPARGAIEIDVPAGTPTDIELPAPEPLSK